MELSCDSTNLDLFRQQQKLLLQQQQNHSGPTGDNNVTLLSYNNHSGKGGGNFLKNQHRKFVQNQTTNNYVVSSSAQTSQCKKLNFRTPFRRRSKSASRLDEKCRSLNSSRSNLADLEDSEFEPITYRANGEKQENLQEKSAVTLVGFSNRNSEFSHNSRSASFDDAENCPNSRFATLRTSREVKMERERLRQEKLHRLTQVLLLLI